MGLELEYKDGQTPLSEEEQDGLLIDSVTTHGELDEFEQMNIQKAMEWVLMKKFKKEYILSEEFVRELHKRMLKDVWKWAGDFRLTEKNIGIEFYKISTALKQLNDDCLFWIGNKTFTEEEIAIWYKYKLVSIHCFSNGNGRHSRLMADIIMKNIFNRDYFSWGYHTDLVKSGEQRSIYLAAIKKADSGDIQPLIKFANS